jgi:acyl carrier protein
LIEPDIVRKTIARILTDIKGDSFVAGSISAETDLLAEVGLDSLELTELILRLEDELDIEMNLTDFNWESLRNLDRFVNLVLRSAEQ